MPLSSHHPSGRPARRLRLAALGLAAVTATAGLVAVAGPASAAPVAPAVPAAVPAPPAPVWTTCASATLQAYGARCTFVTVPKDYADRSAGTIKLAVSRVLHTTANYQGVMLVNPGGPGGSGLIYSVFQGFVPKNAGRSYDWIGFDPRGVGSSVPADDVRPDVLGYNRPGLHRDDARAGEGPGCNGPRPTPRPARAHRPDPAAEHEHGRQRQGHGQHPARARPEPDQLLRFLLRHLPRPGLRDAVPEPPAACGLRQQRRPHPGFDNADLDQDIGFDRNITLFFGWIAKYDTVYHLGTTAAQVSAFYYGTLDQLRRNPQAAGRVGPDEWNDTIVPAAYYQLTWLDTADLMAAAARALPSGARAPTPPDGVQRQRFRRLQRHAVHRRPLARQLHRHLEARRARLRASSTPFLTWNEFWFSAPCLTWPVAADTPPLDGRRPAGHPEILLINATRGRGHPVRRGAGRPAVPDLRAWSPRSASHDPRRAPLAGQLLRRQTRSPTTSRTARARRCGRQVPASRAPDAVLNAPGRHWRGAVGPLAGVLGRPPQPFPLPIGGNASLNAPAAGPKARSTFVLAHDSAWPPMAPGRASRAERSPTNGTPARQLGRGPCPPRPARLGARAADLVQARRAVRVPRRPDWTRTPPTGRRSQLAVSRVKAPTTKRQGIMLVNPGGPGGSGLDLLGPARPSRRTSAGLRLDRLRPARRRVQHAGALAATRTTSAVTGPTTSRPTHGACRRPGCDRVASYAQACAARTTRSLLNHMTTATPPATWTHPAGARRRSRSTTTASPTAPTSVRSTRRCSRPRAPDGARQQRRPAPRLVQRQPRPGRRVHSTITAYLRLGREARQLLPPRQPPSTRSRPYSTAMLDQLRRTPQNGGKVGPGDDDAFLPAGYYQLRPGPASPTSSCRPSSTTRLRPPVTAVDRGARGRRQRLRDVPRDPVHRPVQWPQSYSRTWKPDALRGRHRAVPDLGQLWFNSPCLTWPAAPQSRSRSTARPRRHPAGRRALDAATPYPGASWSGTAPEVRLI